VLTRQGTYPSQNDIAFAAPTAIQGARQVTFGFRWAF